MNFRGPFDSQRVSSWRFRHWLGTDQIGRDVAAGMIRGTRIALAVGIIAMTIATSVGLFLGALAGYFGDHHLRIPRGHVIFSLLALAPAWFHAFNVRGFALQEGPFAREMLVSLGIFAAILAAANLLALPLRAVPWFRRSHTVPADFLVMRLVEIINAIPALLLILSSPLSGDHPSSMS
jgi:peptide/nickel transport system permease protein